MTQSQGKEESPCKISSSFILCDLKNFTVSYLQNLDGTCIQSVSLVVDEDPRTEVTLSHLGEVFVAGQYRVTLPYSNGNFSLHLLQEMEGKRT